MGEDFQFSRPYKWRYSKLFHRLFVYCSRLLIARDNSTGFTIQWLQGSIGIKTDLAINFPRSFSLARSVVCGGIEWGGTDRSRAGYVGVQSYNNSQVVVMQPSGATAYSWLQFRIVAVGFS